MESSCVWEHVHKLKIHMYRYCGNFICFISLISTHTDSKLQYFNSTFALVSTFIVQSFIS